MGMLIEGRWIADDVAYRDGGGRFVRPESPFHWVTADGGAGRTGTGGFKAEAGRYHLYVSLACPWAHRTLIVRALKGLERVITVSIVHPVMGEDGWVFGAFPGAIADGVNGAARLHELYTRAKPDFTGRVTVPVLWDKERRTIVNNESSEIIRMLNGAFAPLGAGGSDLYPAALRAEIDAVNAEVYANVNNGVYRCGFATTQAAYDAAFDELFATLDRLEARLDRQPFLAGAVATEADWRLFPTLVRFDAVYHGHFKCNRQKLAEYPCLAPYTRALYQTPGVAATVDMDHIRTHYYTSMPGINPTRIVARGPLPDFDRPHDRATRRYG